MNSYFFVPYIVLYARHLRIALGLLLVIEAVFALLTVLFDLPAGHVADRIGSRQALIAGGCLQGLAALLLGAIPNAAVFWAAQPLFAGSLALTMGADAALAAGVLRRAGRFESFEAGERLFQSLALATTAAVLMLASALSLLDLRATFLATAAAQFAAAVVLLHVPDVRSVPDTAAKRLTMLARLRGLASGVRTSAGLPLDLISIVFTSTAFSVLLYLMPIYYTDSGIGEHLVGVVSAGGALLAAAISARLTRRWPLRIITALAVVASAALSTELLAAVVAASVVIQSAQAQLLPRYRARVLADLRAHGESTALSIVTTSRNLGFAVLAPFLGALTAAFGPRGLGALCAALFLFGWGAMSTRMSAHARATRQLEVP